MNFNSQWNKPSTNETPDQEASPPHQQIATSLHWSRTCWRGASEVLNEREAVSFGSGPSYRPSTNSDPKDRGPNDRTPGARVAAWCSISQRRHGCLEAFRNESCSACSSSLLRWSACSGLVQFKRKMERKGIATLVTKFPSPPLSRYLGWALLALDCCGRERNPSPSPRPPGFIHNQLVKGRVAFLV